MATQPQTNLTVVQEGQVRLLRPGLRRLLYVSGALVLIIGAQLYVLTDHTNRAFAWTIHPGLTAAFLGAGYLASFFLEFLSARERIWARARMAGPAVLAFSFLTLVATLIHRDRFHFHSPHPVALLSAWAWLAVYFCVPVFMSVLLISQARTRGADPPRRAPIPTWSVALIGAQGALMLGLGAALFIAPKATAPIWPWTLTPLTGRAVGAWLLGLGVAAAGSMLERDLDRLRPTTVAFALFGGLELIALARYAGDVDWGGPAGWLYLAFLISVLGLAAAGWTLSERLIEHSETRQRRS